MEFLEVENVYTNLFNIYRKTGYEKILEYNINNKEIEPLNDYINKLKLRTIISTPLFISNGDVEQLQKINEKINELKNEYLEKNEIEESSLNIKKIIN